jgi:SpoU rRNA Methylase family
MTYICRGVKGCKIVGIEIVEGASPIESHPFEGNTAFILGNEGDGLSSKQMALCDSFVYIRQFGSGTASLNVAVASSIILHHFALWAGFKERDREGFKFVVAERQNRSTKRGIAGGRSKISTTYEHDEKEELSFDLFQGEEGDHGDHGGESPRPERSQGEECQRPSF